MDVVAKSVSSQNKNTKEVKTIYKAQHKGIPGNTGKKTRCLAN